ncbi:hypothetical protein BGZ63DRAFT_395902 [Mariannaea sp. PMI_226]|nr:hypothetical protein BGZ63DRAFT_395902 [Mariannaea sp. PMI_226]
MTQSTTLGSDAFQAVNASAATLVESNASTLGKNDVAKLSIKEKVKRKLEGSQDPKAPKYDTIKNWEARAMALV